MHLKKWIKCQHCVLCPTEGYLRWIKNMARKAEIVHIPSSCCHVSSACLSRTRYEVLTNQLSCTRMWFYNHRHPIAPQCIVTFVDKHNCFVPGLTSRGYKMDILAATWPLAPLPGNIKNQEFIIEYRIMPNTFATSGQVFCWMTWIMLIAKIIHGNANHE